MSLWISRITIIKNYWLFTIKQYNIKFKSFSNQFNHYIYKIQFLAVVLCYINISTKIRLMTFLFIRIYILFVYLYTTCSNWLCKINKILKRYNKPYSKFICQQNNIHIYINMSYIMTTFVYNIKLFRHNIQNRHWTSKENTYMDFSVNNIMKKLY